MGGFEGGGVGELSAAWAGAMMTGFEDALEEVLVGGRGVNGCDLRLIFHSRRFRKKNTLCGS